MKHEEKVRIVKLLLFSFVYFFIVVFNFDFYIKETIFFLFCFISLIYMKKKMHCFSIKTKKKNTHLLISNHCIYLI